MRDCACASCGLAFEPKAEGQIACSFKCARLMVARESSRTRATERAAAAEKPRIAAALAETRANVAGLLKWGPS